MPYKIILINSNFLDPGPRHRDLDALRAYPFMGGLAVGGSQLHTTSNSTVSVIKQC